MLTVYLQFTFNTQFGDFQVASGGLYTAEWDDNGQESPLEGMIRALQPGRTAGRVEELRQIAIGTSKFPPEFAQQLHRG